MQIEKDDKHYIEYLEDDTRDMIFVRYFGISPEYRGKGLSRVYLKELSKKYKKSLYLDCDLTLVEFYLKIGFEDNGLKFDQDYHEMILRYIP